jgi:hypothetical protein
MKYVYLCDRCRTFMCRTCSEPMRHPFENNASHIAKQEFMLNYLVWHRHGEV